MTLCYAAMCYLPGCGFNKSSPYISTSSYSMLYCIGSFEIQTGCAVLLFSETHEPKSTTTTTTTTLWSRKVHCKLLGGVCATVWDINCAQCVECGGNVCNIWIISELNRRQQPVVSRRESRQEKKKSNKVKLFRLHFTNMIIYVGKCYYI